MAARRFSTARDVDVDPDSTAAQEQIVSALLQELLRNCQLLHTVCFLHAPFASVYKM